VIVDLEDAVVESEKGVARQIAAEWLRQPSRAGQLRYVRINDLRSPYWQKDVEEIVPCGPDALVVPKAEDCDAIRLLDETLSSIEQRSGRPVGMTKVVLLIETALGIVRMADLLSSSGRITTAFLGVADLCADSGISLDLALEEPTLFLAERVRMVLLCRSLGLQPPWDAVYLRLNDSEGLRRDAYLGRQIGCQGKVVIHPGQLSVVQEVSTVTDEEVRRAEHVLALYDAAKREGSGVALTEDGSLIDAPVVQWAKDILRRRDVQSK
jgi:citrate lyase subunit beta/citryl-CoA lyase